MAQVHGNDQVASVATGLTAMGSLPMAVAMPGQIGACRYPSDLRKQLIRVSTSNPPGTPCSAHRHATDRSRAILRIVTLSLIHISQPTRLGMISYAVFCLTK